MFEAGLERQSGQKSQKDMRHAGQSGFEALRLDQSLLPDHEHSQENNILCEVREGDRRKLDKSSDEEQLRDLAKQLMAKESQEKIEMKNQEAVNEIIVHIQEIIGEFDDSFGEISNSLQPHISSDEIILTFGYSKLALTCFIEAKNEEK